MRSKSQGGAFRPTNGLEKFLERFPALRRIGIPLRRGSIPIVRQLSAFECGGACLSMVLGYYGKQVTIDELRDSIDAGRDGVTAALLLDVARRHGLRGRGVRIHSDDLAWLPRSSILHWEFRHFVVFDRIERNGVRIIDPSRGPRCLPVEEFRKSFTGIALVLEPGEHFVRQRTRGSAVWRIVHRMLAHSGTWMRALAISLLLQLFALALPVLTGMLVDRVLPNSDGEVLRVLAVGLAALVMFNFLAASVRAQLLIVLRTHLDIHMTLGLVEHLVSLPYAFFQRRTMGDITTRLNSNQVIREQLSTRVLAALLNGCLAISHLVLLFVISPAIMSVALIFSGLELLIFLLTRKRMSELLADGLLTQAKSEGYQIEVISGIATLKGMGAERHAIERWSNLFIESVNVWIERARTAAWVDSTTASLRLAAPLTILLVGGRLVLSGDITMGAMLAVSALAAGFLGPFSELIVAAFDLLLLRGYVERIEDVFQAKVEQNRDEPRPAPQLKGKIDLKNVSFRYTSTSPCVVKDVSLTIEPGEFVAIVGRSGSGKSTLASLLLGLYAPSEGLVAYDDIDLARLDLTAVRRQLGIVTQQTNLFGGSIRSNIALTDPALPLEKIVESARLAQIEDDINRMSMGYDTLLVDGGAGLSGGQRQRLAMARALVHGPQILLLDEATSSLDAILEKRIHDALGELRCTRVVIAHRLSTVVNADRIIVVDNGRVIESGRHGDLLAGGGLYAELVGAQLAKGALDRSGRASVLALANSALCPEE